MNELLLTDECVKCLTGSPTEQSTSTIQAVIRLPSNPSETLNRTNVCLALYFDPDDDPEIREGVRAAFVRALDQIPVWAMHRAFDRWVKTASRRPSPAEIVILAQRELQPMTTELDKRQRDQERIEFDRWERESRRISPAAATEIMDRAGFTPRRMEAVRANPMARSLDEAIAATAERVPHWSEGASIDDPRWDMLRQSREAAGLMQPLPEEGQ